LKVYSPAFISVLYPFTRASVSNMKALSMTPASSSLPETLSSVSPFTTSTFTGPSGACSSSPPVAVA
jgi:hypothetical protein